MTGQDVENKAVNDFKDALLKINGALLKSGTDTSEVVIMLPKEDWKWWYTVLSYENSNANKFFKPSDELPNEFKLGGISVRSFGGK